MTLSSRPITTKYSNQHIQIMSLGKSLLLRAIAVFMHLLALATTSGYGADAVTYEAAMVKASEKLQESKFADAFIAANEAAELDKTRAEPHVLAGKALFSLNQPENLPLARKCFQKALDLSSDGMQAEVKEYIALVEAKQEFIRLLKIGRDAEMEGLFPKAAKEYTAAWHALPLRQEIGIKAAQTWLQIGKPLEASKIVTYILAHPIDVKITELARQMMKEILPALRATVHPLLEEGRKELEGTGGSPTKAIALLSQAADLMGGQKETQILLARAFAKAGKPDQAIESLLVVFNTRTPIAPQEVLLWDEFRPLAANDAFRQFIVDAFGDEATKLWSYRNYWGNGADGVLNTINNISLESILDGDVIVRQYSKLTINVGHTMTVSNRCKGLVIYVDGDCVINGTLTMTACGASADPTQPDSIAPTGIRLIRRKKGGIDTLVSSDVGGTGAGGVGMLWRSFELLQPGINGNGKIYTIAQLGGAGGAGFADRIYSANNSGEPHLMGTGGGGSGGGGDTPQYAGGGSQGTCFSGGSGGGGAPSGDPTVLATNGALFGGKGGDGGSVSGATYFFGAGGGGAGNSRGGAGAAKNPYGAFTDAKPGGVGTGGLLVLCVRGNLSVGDQGKVSANGVNGGAGGFNDHQHGGGGGGSGGGRVVILYAGDLKALGAIEAVGGKGGNDPKSNTGGDGGAGAITVEQIEP
jgi:tetratricopeptide (TPR) repeat protein